MSIYLSLNQAFTLKVLFILSFADGERWNLRTDFVFYPNATCVSPLALPVIISRSFILPLPLCIYLLLTYSSLYL